MVCCFFADETATNGKVYSSINEFSHDNGTSANFIRYYVENTIVGREKEGEFYLMP
ncbi:hypothetical protein McpSp1_14250 [Methanocorpusculaceae archaeon Sp1]|nr:hypothetical protein [Methanocorpusculaceae archaeon Sp1]